MWVAPLARFFGTNGKRPLSPNVAPSGKRRLIKPVRTPALRPREGGDNRPQQNETGRSLPNILSGGQQQAASQSGHSEL